MKLNCFVVFLGVMVALIGRSVWAFPGSWDDYLRYLNTQVTEINVPNGTTYWRVHSGVAIPPPDIPFGDIKIWYRTVNENGTDIHGIPIRVFSTTGGNTVGGGPSWGEFIMGGGNWLDFYNQPGPYSLEVNDGTNPSEACKGLGLPGNEHFSYIITFQRAIKGVTPTALQPTPLGRPDGVNLLVNPGAETGNLSGWSQQGMGIDGDIFKNCGNRAGQHRFSRQSYDGGSGGMAQSVSVVPGDSYTFGFWVSKKAESSSSATLTATWADTGVGGSGGGTLYFIPASQIIFPIYGTRQDATIVPQSNQVTVTISMNHTGPGFAAFHLDEFWFVRLSPPGPPVIGLSPESFTRETFGLRPVSDDVFTVQNVGDGILEYTISDDADWLATNPSAGTSGGEADTITVSYDMTGLPADTYQATITVTDPEADNSPKTIDVTVTVRTPGDFDNDGDVDQEDFGRFQVCLTGTGVPQPDPACGPAKMDDKVGVDQTDYALFAQCMTGANIPASLDCASGP